MIEHDFIKKLKEQNSFECVFCHKILPNIDSIVKYKYCLSDMNDHEVEMYISSNYDFSYLQGDDMEANDSFIIVEYITCPQCQKTSISVYRPITEERIPVFPKSHGKIYPDYIPQQIRKDYEEACSIIDLSPKASATLSRRCLQGMIRDFFEITKSTLFDEIKAVSQIAGLSASQISALNALREIGNIGAHPERNIDLIVEVEPGEAQVMISLIEFFMQHWYIQRHDEEEMMNNIANIAAQKKELRKNPQEQN